MTDGHDPYDEAGQAALREERELAALGAQQRTDRVIKAQMRTRMGRRFVNLMLEQADGLPVYAPNAMEMARRAGQKEAAKWLEDRCEVVCPDEFDLMRKERRNDRIVASDRSKSQP